jgi:hypothetical protein
MKTITLTTIILLSIGTSSLYAGNNDVIVTENPSTKKANERRDTLTKKRDIKPSNKKDISHTKNLKPKTDLDKNRDKYPGVEWKPKEGQNKYPGVEWKPKEGDPIKGKNLNTYPGVEWTPKK